MSGERPVNQEQSPVKFTYDDFLLFPDDGKRHEIIDGEHFVTPSPSTRHQRLSMRLTEAFLICLRDHPMGEIFAAPFDVVFSNFDVVEPDLLYIAAEHSGVLTDKHVRGAPDLVIEILSGSTRKRDEQIKRRLYEQFGVQEYWVVDPELETIKVYRRSAQTFERVAECSRETRDVLTTPLLPGLSILLDELFR